MEDVRNNNQQDSAWTTTQAAAKALGVSPRTVRLYIERGELDGRLEQGTDKRVWLVSIDSLNKLRAKRRTGGMVPVTEPEIAEAIRDLTLRLESRAAEAAELGTRLESTARTLSSIEAERNRLEAALAREQERTEQLQIELEAIRSKGFVFAILTAVVILATVINLVFFIFGG